MAAAEDSKNVSRKTFVLCFDGTGNKFSGTDSDSNILKIYRLLDRTQANQFHYYQPGIGTYVNTNSLDHTSPAARFKSWYEKNKDSAVGTSFATHVMAGYRFLMRYYSPEDDIYFFGFSRGAYTARFLAEMLDHVGLLSSGNEELQRFAWKCFSRWEARRGGNSEEEKKAEYEMYTFMKNFRETFSRPVHRIRFLGLFDTVNSVPRFESAWMQRTKFPYTARSSAKVIRHAVSIDERRAKFRNDLVSGSNQTVQHDVCHPVHRYQSDLPTMMATANLDDASTSSSPHQHGPQRYSVVSADQGILELWFPGGHADIGGGWPKAPGETWALSHAPLVWMVQEAEKAGLQFDRLKMAGLLCCPDKIDEYGHRDTHHEKTFRQALRQSATTGFIHDCLEFGGGLPGASVLSWKIMEYLPFRRMDLKADGSWKAIRWPLPGGETRDIPADAKIHSSAIQRMQHDPSYRPGNLVLMGKGGRGVRKAPQKYGTGEWQVWQNEGDPVSEAYVKKPHPPGPEK